MEELIRFILSNFSLTFFVLGVFMALRQIRRHRGERSRPFILEKIFSQFLFWVMGVTYLYNALMHIAFGAMAARYIGWAQSPFQLEVGFASLGFSLLGFLAWKGSFDLRAGTILASNCFLLGCAGGHVYQIVTAGNLAPGNAGVILYMAVLSSIAGFFLLFATRPAVSGRK